MRTITRAITAATLGLTLSATAAAYEPLSPAFASTLCTRFIVLYAENAGEQAARERAGWQDRVAELVNVDLPSARAGGSMVWVADSIKTLRVSIKTVLIRDAAGDRLTQSMSPAEARTSYAQLGYNQCMANLTE